MTARPASGRYPPTLKFQIVADVRKGLTTAAVARFDHGLTEDEWREWERGFDAGEMRVTRLRAGRAA